MAIYKNFELSGLSSYGRSGIIEEYLGSLDSPVNLLFGTDLESLDAIAILAQPHNSYVLLHSYTGLLGFFTVVTTLIIGIIRLSEGNLGLMLIVASFPLRVFFDSVCFFSNIDFCIYIICLSAVCNSPLLGAEGKASA